MVTVTTSIWNLLLWVLFCLLLVCQSCIFGILTLALFFMLRKTFSGYQPARGLSAADMVHFCVIVRITGGSSKEQFISPLVLPKLPSRVYVRFGEAISLEGLDKRDKHACQEAYERVKDEVELGIDSLLRAREQDDYLDPATRLLYERVKEEQAPTFPAAVLDAAVSRTKLAREGKRRRQRHSEQRR